MVTDEIFINGLRIIAPGLVDPDKSLAILCGDQQWQAEPMPKLEPSYLPPNERRRTTQVIKLALQIIQPLLHSEEDMNQIATVFASSDGDLSIEDKICESLAQIEKMVSPTQFHNSVHNAPAGYCSIATSMSSASISLSAGDSTFSAGLIEAVTQVICERNTVLFVGYDYVAPVPLDAARHFDYSLGLGLRLGTKRESGCLGSISLSLEEIESEISTCRNNSLEPLRTGNPIGIGLPLIEALVSKSTQSIVIPHMMDRLLQININQ